MRAVPVFLYQAVPAYPGILCLAVKAQSPWVLVLTLQVNDLLYDLGCLLNFNNPTYRLTSIILSLVIYRKWV